VDTNAANRFSIHLYGEYVHGIVLIRKGDEFEAVSLGIGMRKAVGHVRGYIRVVGVFQQVGQVAEAPGTEYKVHGPGFDAR